MSYLVKISLFFLIAFMFGLSSSHSETVRVKLSTTAGDIHLELYADKAPITVENFLKYIDAGLMNEGSFYRVVRMDNQAQNNIKIEVIQGGIASNDAENTYPPILLERTKITGIKHLDGTISMARNGPDTATSEFFICVNDQPSLDFGGMRNPDGQGFAAFGQVTKGMDVVKKIQNMKSNMPNPAQLEYTSGQSLIEPVQFISFTRE